MAKLKKSPFKANRIEGNPDAFGLRHKEIIACSEGLFNSRSILISGPRGIGKSSLGNQMQKTLEGNGKLLERCGIETAFPKTLCLYYACDRGNSLQQLVLDLLYSLEQKCLLLPESKFAFELNLGVIKASLESDMKRRSPATLATQLISGLAAVVVQLKAQLYQAINIMFDEVDQIADEINFGHFIKIVHEALQSSHLPVTFVLAGQQGVYTRFMREDASFERIVRHVPLSILEPESSEYILDYAAQKAVPSFRYEKTAKEMLLGLASGYPYVLHLLGDAAYMEMENDTRMKRADVLFGVDSILHTDKREKYVSFLRKLKDKERRVLMTLGTFEASRIPAEIPISRLQERIEDYRSNRQEYDSALASLIEQGVLLPIRQQPTCRFLEELLRVFISLTNLEQIELMRMKASTDFVAELREMSDQEIADKLLSGEIRIAELDPEVARVINQRLRDLIVSATFENDWDVSDLLELAYNESVSAVVNERDFDLVERDIDLTGADTKAPSDQAIVDTILAVFELGDIENMSYELGITYEKLPKDSKRHVVEFVVRFARKRELTRELIRMCQEAVPNIGWEPE